MKKIVINARHGGFGLSHEAHLLYAKKKGWTLYPEGKGGLFTTYWKVPPEARTPMLSSEGFYAASHEARKAHNDFYTENVLYARRLDRSDPILIEVIEELGEEAASGECASLEIVEIPTGTLYRITEYDGYESIEYGHSVDWSVA